ncbi:hypothetical protein JXA63_04965 [Candidatus Woesebacteria bacterium]|nr:hypothetical protein [Candidatus Woesebacteria bacterium]
MPNNTEREKLTKINPDREELLDALYEAKGLRSQGLVPGVLVHDDGRVSSFGFRSEKERMEWMDKQSAVRKGLRWYFRRPNVFRVKEK